MLQSQNYLRVSDPNSWWATSVNPTWHEYVDHPQLDEVILIMEPQGNYTEIGFFATISQGPDIYSVPNYELIWQFDLPPQSVVHDSWLWVGSDIIKADVVDYWTALQTYEDIVDRQLDPSFLYQLGDKRYEIRIFPLPLGDARKIKMSFLVPTDWLNGEVINSVLRQMIGGTQYLPEVVKLGMPISPDLNNPVLQIDTEELAFLDTVTTQSGQVLHWLEVDANTLISAETAAFKIADPREASRSFIQIYEDLDDAFYQVYWEPDWSPFFHPDSMPIGIVDYITQMDNGICFQRYHLNPSNGFLPIQDQPLKQVGKYLGDFPMQLTANLVTDDGLFYTASETITLEDVFLGDTLMREMWYGSHLVEQESLIDTEEDREQVIETSIAERVLTGLTAFLALEPGLGGTPCIECLIGDPIIVSTGEPADDIESLEAFCFPNPASEVVDIFIKSPDLEQRSLDGWEAVIFDQSQRQIHKLGAPTWQSDQIRWSWSIDETIANGIYFCKISNGDQVVVTKIVVQKAP